MAEPHPNLATMFTIGSTAPPGCMRTAQSEGYSRVSSNTTQVVITEQACLPYKIKIELKSTSGVDGAVKSRGDKQIKLGFQLRATKNEARLLKGPGKTVLLTYREKKEEFSIGDGRDFRLFARVLCKIEKRDINACPSRIFRTQRNLGNPHESSAVFGRRHKDQIKLSKGKAEIGVYIMHHCPHHNLLHLVLTDSKNRVLAEGTSMPIFIKDDRRSQNQRGKARQAIKSQGRKAQHANGWPETNYSHSAGLFMNGASSPLGSIYDNKQEEEMQDEQYACSTTPCSSPVEYFTTPATNLSTTPPSASTSSPSFYWPLNTFAIPHPDTQFNHYQTPYYGDSYADEYQSYSQQELPNDVATRAYNLTLGLNGTLPSQMFGRGF